MRAFTGWVRQVAVWSVALALGAVATAPASAARKTTKQVVKTAAPAPQPAPRFTPAVTIVPEVFTPAGSPRMYPVGGGRETQWQPGMPIFIGDRVVLNTFVSTGDATLREVRVRVDNEPVRTLTQAPWQVELDTAGWKPGYHFVEVFGQSSSPEVPSGSATLVLYAREPMPMTAQAPPQTITETTTGAVTESTTEVVTSVAGVREAPDTEAVVPAHPGIALPEDAEGRPQYPEGLAVTVHSRSPQAEQVLRSNEVVRISEPTLFSVTAGPRAQRFVYVLSRQGREIFRSEPLPINSLVRLQPKLGADAVGLIPGELSLWVWAGDGEGRYGAPTRARVEIVAPSQ